VPVLDLLRPKLAVTLELALLAFVLGTGAALLLGTLAARHEGGWSDAVLRLFTIGGAAAPSFWLGILVVLALSRTFDYFPFLTYRSPLDDPWRNLQHLLFPALALGWRQAAVTGRMVRAALLDTLQEDYVRTARAKGLGDRAVLWRHAMRNAALPVVTLLGFQAAHLIGGVVVIEQVFNLPGLGRALVDAVLARDYPVVQALVLFFALVTVAATLAVDLAYALLDPRVRYA
jgi:peptide/nickel transport system permease protein